MNSVNGKLEFVSNNGDTPQLLIEVSEFVNAMKEIGIALTAVVTLTADKVERVDSASSATPAPGRSSADDITLYEGHPSLAPADPTPAAPALRDPDEPQEPSQWNLTPLPTKRQMQRAAAEAAQPVRPLVISQAAVDATVAELAGGALFRNQEREMREEIVLQFGASLVEALGRIPGQKEFDERRPAWMPSASSVASTWERTWVDWGIAFELRAGK